MKKFLSLLGVFFPFAVFAQTPSPEQFLGYKPGERFTPHYRILAYFEAAARANPQNIQLRYYGDSYEGRPLVLAFVSAPENLQRLDSIRINNLRLARLADGSPNKAEAKAIIWMSYNVHGNEPSPSEAAMVTLYKLTADQSDSVRKVLSNTVIIIDPCVNPDGRDRYTNWYNSVAALRPDPDPYTREHNEPWPGGRTNHYNFDLNRDWAWQTQQESRLRVKEYLQWMPHVHVDFHEQFFNSPYFFAPAAEPFHEVITPWQLEFQTEIGKNNARYFDKNGWLYFTREQFDLFYPSYGDTYPTYNGAIGMTYEQAGHSRAGLAVKTADGDTLRLADRILHHVTTGLSTVEATAGKAARVVEEFADYFEKAMNGHMGEYAAYVIKHSPRNAQKLELLKELLTLNGVSFGYGKQGGASGLSYFSGKEEKFQIDNADIVIDARQPRAAMVKVLMEPRTKLRDSVTYDITAWALPYAYGLDAFACRVRPNYSTAEPAQPSFPALPDAYAYAVNWTSKRSAALLGRLLRLGVRVRCAQEPFTLGGQHFERGTLIIPRASNQYIAGGLPALLSKINAEEKIPVYPLHSGFAEKGYDIGSEKMKSLRRTKVGLLTGDQFVATSVGEIWHFFEQELHYPVSMINHQDLNQVNWNELDVLIVANNNAALFSDKKKNDKLREWVNNGGTLIAIENAVSQLAAAEWGIKPKKSEDSTDGKKDPYALLKKYADRERDGVSAGIPGAIYRAELDNTHPLAFGYGNHYYTLKTGDKIYDYFGSEGWNVGVLKKDNFVSGFTGSSLKPHLTDGLLIGVQPIGRGEVVYFADDPLFRSFWENGKLMFCNAVFLLGQ